MGHLDAGDDEIAIPTKTHVDRLQTDICALSRTVQGWDAGPVRSERGPV